MNLQLNLATKVYVDFRTVNLIIAVLFFIILVWLCFDSFMIINNYDEMRKIKGYTLTIQSKGKDEKISEIEYNKVLAEIKFANSILEKRSYDWLSMLDNLEQVVPPGVSLKSVIPDVKSGQLKLSGVAVNFASVRKAIENLEKSPKFTEVFLTDQSYTKEAGSQKGMSFSVTCKAVP